MALAQWKLQDPQVELRGAAGRLSGVKNGAATKEVALTGCWKSGQAGSLASRARRTAGPMTRRQRTERSRRELFFFMVFLSEKCGEGCGLKIASTMNGETER